MNCLQSLPLFKQPMFYLNHSISINVLFRKKTFITPILINTKNVYHNPRSIGLFNIDYTFIYKQIEIFTNRCEIEWPVFLKVPILFI